MKKGSALEGRGGGKRVLSYRDSKAEATRTARQRQTEAREEDEAKETNRRWPREAESCPTLPATYRYPRAAGTRGWKRAGCRQRASEKDEVEKDVPRAPGKKKRKKEDKVREGGERERERESLTRYRQGIMTGTIDCELDPGPSSSSASRW